MIYIDDYFDQWRSEFKDSLQILKELISALELTKNDTKKWVRTNEAMEILSCSKSQLQRYRRDKKVISKKIGNTVYHDIESLNQLIENGK